MPATTEPSSVPKNRLQLDLLILALGVACLAFVLLIPGGWRDRSYLYVEHDSGHMLKHGHFTDLTQDVIGARAIWNGTDAYPKLTPVLKRLGINMDIPHQSTHPPTAFLLVAPVAWMPLNPGAVTWAWSMIACLAVSFLCLGCSISRATGLAMICMVWPPGAFCLGQLTPVWLLGVCGSWRLLAKSPAISGALLSIAAATKMAPALLLWFMIRRPRALLGFIAVMTVFLVVILVKDPGVIHGYQEVVKNTVPRQAGRPDNGSIVGRASHYYGSRGRLAALAFLAAVLGANYRDVLRGNYTGWCVLNYLAVAVLPILWVYSVIPLLFITRFSHLRHRRISLFFFASFLIATTVLPIWDRPTLLALTVAWLGIGLIVTGGLVHGDFSDHG